jgi:hypothetical protein
MGWGITICQNEDGFLMCEDAGFETSASDYDGYPPSSYDFIAEHFEQFHSEIDMARDEMGLNAARQECWEAFENAQKTYHRLTEEEKIRMHRSYINELSAELKTCIVDSKRKNDKEAQIDFVKIRYGPAIGKLEADIAWLESELAKKRRQLAERRAPLDLLENELACIVQPAERKKELQESIRKERSYF